MSARVASSILVWMFVMMAVPAAAATVGPTQTGYPVLRLTPSATTVNVGDTFTVEISISGFADADIAGLSSFDIGVGTVASLFSVESYSLGTTLGDPDLGESNDTSAGQIGPNTFNVGLSSNLSADYLGNQLPDAFVLASLDITALATTSACQCIVIAASPQLYDGNGSFFYANVINDGVSVTVVPLPAAVWLFVAALAVLPWRRDSKRS